MKTLIIEDEIPNALRLTRLLKGIDPTIEVLGPLTSIAEVRRFFSDGGKADIIFSDIRLNDGLVFEAFEDKNFSLRIIFTTAYSEYALKAFDYNCVHYLLKPIDEDELASALSKALLLSPRRVADMNPLREGSFRESFEIDRGAEIKLVQADQTALLLYEDGATELFTAEGSQGLVKKSMNAIETELDPKIFFRASRQCLINRNFIGKISYKGLRTLSVEINCPTPFKVDISREKSSVFRKWLNR